MDSRDELGSGLPLPYHDVTAALLPSVQLVRDTLVMGSDGARNSVVTPAALSRASSYVTRGPRKPYTAACAWLRVFR